MSDRVSRNIFGAQVLLGLSREGCIEVYIDNRRIFIVVYYIECLTRVQAMLMERGVGGKTMVWGTSYHIIIEQHILDTNAGKQLSYAATGV